MGPIKFWRLSRLSLWCSHVISIFLGCFPLSPSGWQHLDKLTPESGWLYGCCVGAWTILNASSWESSPHIRAPWSVMSVSHMVPCQATKIGRRKKTVLWNGWWKCHGSSWNNIKGAHIQDIPRSCFVAVNKTSFNKSVVHWRHTTALIKQNLNLLYNIIQQFHFHELKLTATEYLFLPNHGKETESTALVRLLDLIDGGHHIGKASHIILIAMSERWSFNLFSLIRKDCISKYHRDQNSKTNSMSREALWRVLNRLWKRNAVKEQAMQHHKTSPCALLGIALIFKKAPINVESKLVSIWGSI